MQDRSPNLGDALDRDFAPAWRPAPGDKLVGHITDLSSRDGEYGRYPIVTVLDDENAEWSVHLEFWRFRGICRRLGGGVDDGVVIG